MNSHIAFGLNRAENSAKRIKKAFEQFYVIIHTSTKMPKKTTEKSRFFGVLSFILP